MTEQSLFIVKPDAVARNLTGEVIARFEKKGFKLVKLKLFKYVDICLDELFKKEAFHKNTISTNSILEEELDALEEEYTVDDGFDYIMNDELDDISYQQDHKHKHLFLYDEHDNSVLSVFEMEDLTENKSKEVLSNIYNWLPLNVSSIIDLLVFGKLNFEEIAKIKSIEVKRVEFIYEQVKNKFKDHIG